MCCGLRIGDWFGLEVIQKYLEMCGIGLLDDFPGIFLFFLERKHGQEIDREAHSRVNYLSCEGALGIAQARRITKCERSIAPPKSI